MKENWKDIKNHEGRYQVSDLGNVRSLDRFVPHNKGGLKFNKGKNLKGTYGAGYKAVGLYCTIKNKLVRISIHRLVAEAFIPNPENKETVNHINMNKDDNRLCNLEWNTYSENNKHSFANNPKRLLSHVGENSNSGKLKNSDVYQIRKMLSEKVQINIIAKRFNVGRRSISNIKHGVSWTHI